MRKLMRYLVVSLLFVALLFGCKEITAFRFSIDDQQCMACGRCAEVCPHNAIEYHGEKPVIIQSRCKQCGDCVAVCPVDAIH